MGKDILIKAKLLEDHKSIKEGYVIVDIGYECSSFEIPKEHIIDIKQEKKTWIIIDWEYIYRSSPKQLDQTPVGKIAKRLYCIETEEIKEI